MKIPVPQQSQPAGWDCSPSPSTLARDWTTVTVRDGDCDLCVSWRPTRQTRNLHDRRRLYEGSIVLLRQLMDAAKLVGNDELETRCGEARKLLIRDVVFAASLYT